MSCEVLNQVHLTLQCYIMLQDVLISIMDNQIDPTQKKGATFRPQNENFEHENIENPFVGSFEIRQLGFVYSNISNVSQISWELRRQSDIHGDQRADVIVIGT